MSTLVKVRWRLVAPWWHWDLRDAPDPERAARAGAPVITKHASADFVRAYLADPQGSLAFTDDDVHRRTVLGPVETIDGRRKRLTFRRAEPTDTRKLFQPAHQRFYLVAFQLHCDEPGFPRVDRRVVASIGFVVRRRRVSLPEGTQHEAARLLQELAAARAAADGRERLEAASARSRKLLPVRSTARRDVVDPARAILSARREVESARRRLRDWTASNGVESTTEGWVAGDDGKVGIWAAVPDEPEELTERWYPMHPLVPDPEDPEHDGRDVTVYFGVVPTASEEVTPDGAARFHPDAVHEIRCFARPASGDCPAPLVWSEPTNGFHLAAFFDPVGSAQRPVDIRLPDLADLEAQAGTQTGGAGAVRMSQPSGPQLEFPKELPISGSVVDATDDEVCFFAIPLITFVATFVLKLFLPIVLFVFGLWWMLKLKFCIPPSASLEGQLNSELSAVPGGIQAVFDLDLDAADDVDQASLRTTLRNGLNAELGAGVGTTLTATYSNHALVELLAGQGYGSPAGGAPSLPVDLPRVPRVRREEVVRP